MAGAAVIGILAYTYAIGIPARSASLFDYFGYFTNLTSLLTAAALIAAGVLALRGGAVSPVLTTVRAVSVSCMIVVGVVYNVLVPGTGSAPAWVSLALHTLFPALLVIDWVFAPDRTRLPWRQLWMVLPYPALWLVVVLIRGVTDGWVPYGFLLPERGALSLVAHVVGLLAALLVSGAGVWALTRLPRRSTRTSRRARQTQTLAQP